MCNPPTHIAGTWWISGPRASVVDSWCPVIAFPQCRLWSSNLVHGWQRQQGPPSQMHLAWALVSRSPFTRTVVRVHRSADSRVTILVRVLQYFVGWAPNGYDGMVVAARILVGRFENRFPTSAPLPMQGLVTPLILCTSVHQNLVSLPLPHR
jgi:hypothetical protein